LKYQKNIIKRVNDLFRKLFLIEISLICMVTVIPITNSKAIGSEDSFIKGYTAYVLKNYKLARIYWKPIAKEGNQNAQYLLGVMYANGQGVKTDFQKASHWFLKSALQGDVGAMYFLGTFLKEGKGINQNFLKAGEWFQKAAEKGYPDAQLQLGEMYASGKGKPKDFLKAYIWMKLLLSKEDLVKAESLAQSFWLRFESPPNN
jgi:TPR repeat protein